MTDEDTVYQKVPGKKILKREELELSQYAIVIGYMNADDESVEAKMVQLIKEPEITRRKTVYGNILNIGKKSLTLVDKSGNEWTVNLSRSTDYTEKTEKDALGDIIYSSLENGELVIAGGIPDEKLAGTLDALLVHRLPKRNPEPTTDETPANEAGGSAEVEK